MNPESEDFYQWSTYKARMEAAIRRADGLQLQVKECQQLLAALVRKAGGEVRLTPQEWWRDRELDRLGVKTTWTGPSWQQREEHDLLVTLNGLTVGKSGEQK